MTLRMARKEPGREFQLRRVCDGMSKDGCMTRGKIAFRRRGSTCL